MSLESELFAKLRPDRKKLKESGFAEQGDILVYEEVFMDGAFLAHIEIADNQISGKVIDRDLQEEYTLFRAVRRSAYASEVRDAYLQILEKIAACFSPVPFASEQANRLASYVEKTWGDIPDSPFRRNEGYVFREPDSKKWYGLIMAVEGSKISASYDDAKKEFLNLKTGDTPVEERLKSAGVFPAWHMNKDGWYTVVLDDTVPDEEIFAMVQESRKAVVPAPSRLSAHDWLIPSNPGIYDVYGAFKRRQVLHWHTRKKIEAGDIIYIYSAAPVSAIILQCVCDGHDSDGATVMRALQFYEPDRYPLAELKAHGLNTVRFITRIPKELKAWLEEN